MTLSEQRVKRLMDSIRRRILAGAGVDDVQGVITKEVHPRCLGL